MSKVALVALMRDVLSIVKVRSSESGYADTSEILSDLRALCDKHDIKVYRNAEERDAARKEKP